MRRSHVAHISNMYIFVELGFLSFNFQIYFNGTMISRHFCPFTHTVGFICSQTSGFFFLHTFKWVEFIIDTFYASARLSFHILLQQLSEGLFVKPEIHNHLYSGAEVWFDL